MPITRLQAENFRSFAALDLRLEPFNVIVGANASGKSNLLGVILFLVRCSQMGLSNAARAFGGQRALPNYRSGSGAITVAVTSKNRIDFERGVVGRRGKNGSTPWVTAQYSLRFSLDRDTGAPRVEGERFEVAYSKQSGDGGVPRASKSSAPFAKITIHRTRGCFRIGVIGNAAPPGPLGAAVAYLNALPKIPAPPTSSMLENPLVGPFVVAQLPDLFGSSFFDLDPRKERLLGESISPPVLSIDGGNLAFILKGLTASEQSRRRLVRLARHYLPFVRDIRVVELGPSLQIQVKESGSGAPYLPSTNISDGSLNVLALVVALHFEHKPLLVIEEPERSVHPQLLSRLVDGLKALAVESQVLVTTHNPEMVRFAGLESLLLLSRTEGGGSQVSRPRSFARVRTFLKQEMGVSDLFRLNQLTEQ